MTPTCKLPQGRSELIGAHLARLEAQLAQTQAAVSSLRRLPDVLDWHSGAMADIRTALAYTGQAPSGPPGGLYDDDLFTEELGDMLVFVPVATPG